MYLLQKKKGISVNSVMQPYLRHFHIPSQVLPSDSVSARILHPSWAPSPVREATLPEHAHVCCVGLGWAQLQLGDSRFNFVNVLLRGAENSFTSYTSYFKITVCLESLIPTPPIQLVPPFYVMTRVVFLFVYFCSFLCVFVLCMCPFYTMIDFPSAFTYFISFLWSPVSSLSYFVQVTVGLVTIVFPYGSSRRAAKAALNLLHL